MNIDRKNVRKRQTRPLSFECLESRRLLSVNGPGISDSALFDTVISLPSDPVIEDFDQIGGVAGETVQLNVADGAILVRGFDVFSGGELNISGGEVGSSLDIVDGTEVNISGGVVGPFIIEPGSTVNISGGLVASGSALNVRSGAQLTVSGGQLPTTLNAFPGSDVELIGGEFKLNGEVFLEPTITLETGDTLSGSFQDGTGFFFRTELARQTTLNDVRLTTVPLPQDNTDSVLIDSRFTSPLKFGQTITLVEGGELLAGPVFVENTVNLEGGIIGERGETINSTINVSDGTLGRFFHAREGSVLNISGGEVGLNFEAYSGSQINVSGGQISSGFTGFSGSELNLSGGEFNFVRAATGSALNISGGEFGGSGAFILTEEETQVSISGGNFREVTFSGSEVDISGGVFSGRLVSSSSVFNISGGEFLTGFFPDSVANISGGEFTGGLGVRSGAELNLSVRELQIDGVTQNLTSGETFTLTERDVTVTGRLSDNSPFSIFNNVNRPPIALDATVNITLGAVALEGVPTEVTLFENAVSPINFSSLNIVSVQEDSLTLTLEASGGVFNASSDSSLTVSGSGTNRLSISGTAENVNAFFDDVSSLKYTGPLNVSGDDVATISITVEGNFDTVLSNPINVDIVGVEDERIIIGTAGDDSLEGTEGDDSIVGGAGSDELFGSAGDDLFTTDEINGDKDRNDQDVIFLGNVDGNDTGNDVVTDFDVNRNNRSENNFDTIQFIFNGVQVSLSTRNEILAFVRTIETDGDVNTDALVDGDDLIFVFGRDSEDSDMITSSVRLEGVVGQNGLTLSRLLERGADILGELQQDAFATSGETTIETGASDDVLEGGADDDVLVGGLGSDTLIGGGGNDVLTGDQTAGDNNRNDQDVFVLGDVGNGGSGNDVITDFDTNNADGGENNFDTLDLSIGDQEYKLATGNDFLVFADILESDGNAGTGTLIDGDDLIFVFSRDADGFITDSVRLEDIITGDGLTDDTLAAFDRIGGSDGIDLFVS